MFVINHRKCIAVIQIYTSLNCSLKYLSKDSLKAAVYYFVIMQKSDSKTKIQRLPHEKQRRPPIAFSDRLTYLHYINKFIPFNSHTHIVDKYGFLEM